MHLGNRDWLNDMQAKYATDIAGRLLEIGSLDVNGSAREHLKAGEWVGVDRVAGTAVDVHCDATETEFAYESFDTLLSTSMLEHNPLWRMGLSHNMKWLKRGGLLLLSWGAEGNLHHLPEPWVPVPVGDVLEWCMCERLVLLEACWERNRYTPDCEGCYDVAARKR